nr:PREDICTED: probable 2-oxoglutarate/Fe(II)-dependent dioxygenase [Daucus carota subsp. sativus]
MRLNYYPPCPQPEKIIGLASHNDAGGLTILSQGNEDKGCEKRDLSQHRAQGDSELKKSKVSIATFIMPNQDADLGPATCA